MTPPDLRASLRRAIAAKAKPQGSLGRLEDLAVQLGLLQDTLRPVVANPVILVFAADHGAAPATSAYPSAVTAAMVRAYLAGHAAINGLAAQAAARLVLVDAGIASPVRHPALIEASMGPGTADWSLGPAMSPATVDAAMARAAALVDTLVDSGTTVIALGEMGIGNTASAALLAHKVAGLPLHVGRGAGLDDDGLARKRHAVERGAARTAATLPPRDALAEYAGFEIVMLAATILRAAERRTALVIDGLIVTAAALVAAAIHPPCLDACIFAHRSAEPGHDAMLAHLGARPLLDLGLRLGEGSGAALAIPLLRAACAIMDMADLADLA